MQLHPDALGVLQQVEQLSGKPVPIYPDPDLSVLARLARARGGEPFHVLTYKPDAQGLDYVVAYQGAFALRFYQTPPPARFDFAGTQQGHDAVKRMVIEPGGVIEKMGLPPSVVEPLVSQFYDGLMAQLRSYPIGIRIDRWIAATLPALRADQRASIDEQIRTNIQALSPHIRAIAPPVVFNANAAMNAAYACFADRLLENPAYSVPYVSVGVLERGRALLDILDEVPDDPTHDKDLVDAWAVELGISDWIAWIPAQES